MHVPYNELFSVSAVKCLQNCFVFYSGDISTKHAQTNMQAHLYKLHCK